jgi:hypothetical protein
MQRFVASLIAGTPVMVQNRGVNRYLLYTGALLVTDPCIDKFGTFDCRRDTKKKNHPDFNTIVIARIGSNYGFLPLGNIKPLP